MRSLIISTGFCIVLIAIRCHISGHTLFLFLVWNLFLAWIPYLISSGLKTLKHGAFLWLIPWLLFLPNAPYIITDLFHLRPRPDALFWLDLLILSASAVTGLMLGLKSLMQVEKLFSERSRRVSERSRRVSERSRRVSERSRRVPTWFSSAGILGVCLLTGFGMYLGRFQRWNSWDLVTRPIDLLSDSLSLITQPEPLGFTIGFGLFLAMAYAVFSHNTHVKTPQPQHEQLK